MNHAIECDRSTGTLTNSYCIRLNLVCLPHVALFGNIFQNWQRIKDESDERKKNAESTKKETQQKNWLRLVKHVIKMRSGLSYAVTCGNDKIRLLWLVGCILFQTRRWFCWKLCVVTNDGMETRCTFNGICRKYSYRNRIRISFEFYSMHATCIATHFYIHGQSVAEFHIVCACARSNQHAVVSALCCRRCHRRRRCCRCAISIFLDYVSNSLRLSHSH